MASKWTCPRRQSSNASSNCLYQWTIVNWHSNGTLRIQKITTNIHGVESTSNRCLISQEDSWHSHINLSFRIILRAQLASVALAFNHRFPNCQAASFLCHTSFLSKSRVVEPKMERNILLDTKSGNVRSPAIPISCWQAMAAIAKALMIWSARHMSHSSPLRRRHSAHSLSLRRNSPQATCNQKCVGQCWPYVRISIKRQLGDPMRPYDTSKYLKPASALCSILLKTMFQLYVQLHFAILCTEIRWVTAFYTALSCRNACERSHLVNSTYEPTASIAGLSISFYSVSPLAEYRGKSRHTLFLSTSTKGQIGPDKKHVQIMWPIGFYPFDDPWWHTLGILPRHGQANDPVTDIGI